MAVGGFSQVGSIVEELVLGTFGLQLTALMTMMLKWPLYVVADAVGECEVDATEDHGF